jgi:hypothetical protein
VWNSHRCSILYYAESEAGGIDGWMIVVGSVESRRYPMRQVSPGQDGLDMNFRYIHFVVD